MRNEMKRNVQRAGDGINLRRIPQKTIANYAEQAYKTDEKKNENIDSSLVFVAECRNNPPQDHEVGWTLQ